MSRPILFGDHPFAVKEHRSRFLHWDLRLHFSGQTLLSFVLRAPPHLDPARPLRAVRVADHKLAYLLDEWIIPPTLPGAGPTALWDAGVFRTPGRETMASQLARGHLRVHLLGRRLNGGFSLKWTGPGEDDWRWTKEWDDGVDPLRRFPNVLTPDKIRELRA